MTRRNKIKRRKINTGRGKKSFWTKNKLIAAIALAAAAVVAVVLVIALSAPVNPEDVTDEQLMSMTYGEGIYIEGVDVSDMVFSDAAVLIQQKADDILKNLSIDYSVVGSKYTVTGYDMGAEIDFGTTMQEAMFAGEGNYSLDITVDRAKLLASVSANCEKHNTEPVDAVASLEKDSNEQNMTVSAKLVITESQDGITVNSQKLADEIANMVETGELMGKKELVAEVETKAPKYTKAFLEENMQIMGEYTTTFKSSSANRSYNVWKMADVICGIVLEPGEVWSINEEAGDRTTENGWRDAAGIVNGAYVDEPGGGICQVSSTLYNAVLRSEVTVEERSHHSWPLQYVPVGLDATISTGKPDFVISNPYDSPIIIAVRCDAGSEKYVRVRIYGPPMDYKLDFTSEIIKEVEPEKSPDITVDPSLSPGASKEVSPRHNELSVQIYKHIIDKETGEEIEKVEYKKEYYAPFAGKVAVGPSASPSASADASQQPEGDATQPTQDAGEGEAPENTETDAPEEPQPSAAPEA